MSRFLARGLLVGLCLAAVFSEAKATQSFRVMTYNIHHGEGRDGRVDLKRIAALIGAEKADIVALQEVDRGVARTGRRDLIGELARLTGMNFYFEKNIDHQGGEFGNAILTRFQILAEKNTHYRMLRQGEQRGLLHVVLDADGQEVLFMNTHLDYHRDDAQRRMNVTQIKETLEEHPTLPVIFCGDFNEAPGGRTYERLSAFLRDAWNEAGEGGGFTFPSINPVRRIDYIWVSEEATKRTTRTMGYEVRPLRAWVAKSDASDHLPIVAEFLVE